MSFTWIIYAKHDCVAFYVRKGNVCTCSFCHGAIWISDKDWKELLDSRLSV